MSWRLNEFSTCAWNLVERCGLNSTHGCCPGPEGMEGVVGSRYVDVELRVMWQPLSMREGGGEINWRCNRDTSWDIAWIQLRYNLPPAMDQDQESWIHIHPRGFESHHLGDFPKHGSSVRVHQAPSSKLLPTHFLPQKPKPRMGEEGATGLFWIAKWPPFFFIKKKKLEFWSHPKLRSQGPSVMDWLETMPREV